MFKVSHSGLRSMKILIFLATTLLVIAPVSETEARERWQRLKSKVRVLPSGYHPVSFTTNLVQKIEGSSFQAYGQTFTIREDSQGVVSYRKGSSRWKKCSRLPYFVKFSTPQGTRAILLRRTMKGNLAWSSHYGVIIVPHKNPIAIVDVDADNKLCEKGEDGIGGPKAWVLGPYRGQVWTYRGGYMIKKERKSGRVVFYKKRIEFPKKGRSRDLNRAWALFNAYRQRAGSGPLSWSDEIAEGCRLHARYCQLNSYRGHHQNPSKAGYTKKGAQAGRSSVCGFAKSSLYSALIEQFRTAYHADDVIQPELETTGMALVAGNFVCNVRKGATRSVYYQGPIKYVWPPHGASRFFRRFNPAGERPMPVLGQKNNYRLAIGQVIMAKVSHSGPYKLVVKEASGRTVPCYLSHPNRSAGNDGNNSYLVIAAPKKPLRSRTRHLAILTLGQGRNKIVFKWHFTTQ